MSFMTNPPDGQIFTCHTTFHRFIWKAICNRMHIRNEKMNPHIYMGFHRCTAIQIWSFPSSGLTCCPFTVGWLIVINLYKKLNIKLPLQKIRIRHKQCSGFFVFLFGFSFVLVTYENNLYSYSSTQNEKWILHHPQFLYPEIQGCYRVT